MLSSVKLQHSIRIKCSSRPPLVILINMAILSPVSFVNLCRFSSDRSEKLTTSMIPNPDGWCFMFHFVFNGEHYIQHEGFAMGSPMSAPMANIFLSHHEVHWLQDCPVEFRPLLYKRYVDDTFLAFEKKDHIEKFFNYMNSRHPNILFTREYESNNKISFFGHQRQ